MEAVQHEALGEARCRVVGGVSSAARIGEAANSDSVEALPNPSKNPGGSPHSVEPTSVAERHAAMLPAVMPYAGQ